MSVEQATLESFKGADSDGVGQCGAPTKDGHSCQLPALKGIGTCVHHTEWSGVTDDSSSSDDRPVWERQRSDLLGDSK